jgi:hypothetical protein
MDKWASSSLKTCALCMTFLRGLERQEWEKIFVNHITDIGLVCKVNNELS